MGEGVGVRALLSLTEVAGLLGVHRKTLERMVGRREIEFVRVGSRIKFRPEVVDAYLAARTTKAKV